MKQFNLKNNELVAVHNAVFNIEVSNTKVNRGKFKLLKLIEKKIKEKDDDRKAILVQYSEKDGDGEAIIENESYTLIEETKAEALEALKDLEEESVAVVYGEYANNIKPYMEFLDSYEGQLDGTVGQGVFLLQEAYEQTLEEEK